LRLVIEFENNKYMTIHEKVNETFDALTESFCNDERIFKFNDNNIIVLSKVMRYSKEPLSKK